MKRFCLINNCVKNNHDNVMLPGRGRISFYHISHTITYGINKDKINIDKSRKSPIPRKDRRQRKAGMRDTSYHSLLYNIHLWNPYFTKKYNCFS